MDLPKIHPRELVVMEVEAKLRAVVFGAMKDSGLTTAEYLSVINNVLHAEVGSVLKYAIRKERHGREDKPGGVE